MTYIEELFGLSGKVAVVTGAARGNGKAISIGLARAGADLVVCDLLVDELTETVNEIEKLGCKVNSMICDLSKSNEISRFSSFIDSVSKSVDILINNAGITMGAPALEYPKEYWDKTYKINLMAPFELSLAIGRRMKKSGGGSIINITSLGAEQAFPNNIAYVTFKGALKQFSKALALDLAPDNIRVNCLGPGYIKTKMTEGSWNNKEMRAIRAEASMIGRWGTPEDLLGAIIFLSSSASSYVTAQDIYVDGGWLAKGI
jgi:NAD(P)-dependent dehydrogenase (short-subunit alcohol dehydrogenase family)